MPDTIHDTTDKTIGIYAIKMAHGTNGNVFNKLSLCPKLPRKRNRSSINTQLVRE